MNKLIMSKKKMWNNTNTYDIKLNDTRKGYRKGPFQGSWSLCLLKAYRESGNLRVLWLLSIHLMLKNRQNMWHPSAVNIFPMWAVTKTLVWFFYGRSIGVTLRLLGSNDWNVIPNLFCRSISSNHVRSNSHLGEGSRMWCLPYRPLACSDWNQTSQWWIWRKVVKFNFWHLVLW